MPKKLSKEQLQALKDVPEDERADILEAWGITAMDDDMMESFKKLLGRVDVLEKGKKTEPPAEKSWWERFVGA